MSFKEEAAPIYEAIKNEQKSILKSLLNLVALMEKPTDNGDLIL